MQTQSVRITAVLEISDHDGHCSDNENEYTRKIVRRVVDIPANIDLDDEALVASNYSSLEQYLEAPRVRLGGSGYCGVSQKSRRAGLDKHEYAYTIQDVERMEG
jgi:hypothetical protein